MDTHIKEKLFKVAMVTSSFVHSREEEAFYLCKLTRTAKKTCFQLL